MNIIHETQSLDSHVRWASLQGYSWVVQFFALTFFEASVPCLYPFFSLRATWRIYLHLPDPSVFLLLALVDQLYLLFLALTPPPDWASLPFCLWKLDLPVNLEMQWEWLCFLPAAGVPLVYTKLKSYSHLLTILYCPK